MSKAGLTTYTPIDDREPATVRAVILARSSDPGAKPEDMREQVEQCRDFITGLGWTLIFDAYAFAESKSGMRNVPRPVLDDVLRLAIRGEVDVIVCREFERIARTKGRRWQAIQTALDYGVEFRFANLPATRGKPDDSGMMRLYQEVREFMAEAEAEKITERLMPAKMRRYEEGLPHGKLYGYAPGERRLGKHGKPMGLLTWVIDEEKTEWVQWMFRWVDEKPPAEVSLRGLAGELARRGAPTPSGKGEWAASQVRNILRNPKYCGQGRGLRFRSEWKPERDPDTNIVRDVLHVHDRMYEVERLARKDPAQADSAQTDYLANTYPILPTAIPPIIDPEQWERVQEKLKAAAALNNRGGPRRTDAEATSTLLDHGYIRCDECNGRMTRHWTTKSKHPYYRCHKNAERPSLPHKMFRVPAHKVDALALKLLAKALTDPEQLLVLADAAEQQAADARVDADLAASELAASHKRVSEITAEQDALLAAQTALSRVPGMDKQIQDIRDRLAQLDKEHEQAKEASTQAIPRRDHANERAEFLRHIFSRQDFRLHFTTWNDGTEGLELTATEVLDDTGKPILEFQEDMVLADAARLLNLSEEEAGALLPVRPLSQYGDERADGTYEALWTEYFIPTVDVIELVLRRAPRERVRKLLHDLDAVVMVKRGGNWAEYVEHGPTPLEGRVYLQLLGTVRVGTDVNNLNISS